MKELCLVSAAAAGMSFDATTTTPAFGAFFIYIRRREQKNGIEIFSSNTRGLSDRLCGGGGLGSTPFMARWFSENVNVF